LVDYRCATQCKAWEQVVPMTNTTDRICNNLVTNITMFWDMDYDAYAGTNKLQMALEKRIRDMLAAVLSETIEDAILRVLFHRGSVGTTLQVLTTNVNATETLRCDSDALFDKVFKKF
jgi:hypothetical protein